MSGGPSCCCAVRDRKRWRVVQYRHHHSAFHGYRRTESDWSSVYCIGCGRLWRTKAAYVESLEHGDWEQLIREKYDGQKET